MLLALAEVVADAVLLVALVEEVVTVALDVAADEAMKVVELALVEAAVDDDDDTVPWESIHVFTSRTASFPLASLIGVNTTTQVSVIGPAFLEEKSVMPQADATQASGNARIGGLSRGY